MADEDLTPEPDAPERDPDTADMFGDPAPTAMPAPAPARAPASEGSAAYTVIARKYRPRTFEDLYGQEAMVRTLRNAFAAGRIAHAFMLTGVRGVGKTTTARLLARALNFQTDSVDAPSLDLSVEGRHCRAIIEGRHMDVLELDAASRTGVADMRDLLDGVRYAPVEARYKVQGYLDYLHHIGRYASEKPLLSLSAYNARDFGFNFLAIDTNRSQNVRTLIPSTTLAPNLHFIHRGGSCGYPGGCNNMSPYQDEIEFSVKTLPAEVVVKLWRTRPAAPEVVADAIVVLKLS